VVVVVTAAVTVMPETVLGVDGESEWEGSGRRRLIFVFTRTEQFF
jgi:hypothetical protein